MRIPAFNPDGSCEWIDVIEPEIEEQIKNMTCPHCHRSKDDFPCHERGCPEVLPELHKAEPCSNDGTLPCDDLIEFAKGEARREVLASLGRALEGFELRPVGGKGE